MYLASRKLCGTTNIIVWDRQKNKPQMKKIKKKFHIPEYAPRKMTTVRDKTADRVRGCAGA